jgi:hypothetical protein
MYRFTIAQSENGIDIYVNLISSSAGHYVSRRPYVIDLLKEICRSANISGPKVVIERNMGRNIGTTDIVETSDTDTIYYAQPIKTATFSRFARNRYPQLSKILTVIMVRDSDGNYEVQDTWIGPSRPPFPGDEHEAANSKVYWQTHALVQDAQAIQSKSITKTCPY